MGNEGSMEGGEGMGGFPEGMAGDGKGGFAQIPAGMEADLSQLSEEERKQIAAVMSRAQELPRGNQTDRPPLRYPNIDTNQSPRHPSKPPDPGPTGLSKSRTVDAFKTEMKTPGRSPSTMSLKEPRSKPDIKEEQKPSMMTGFLTDSNPLSVVSSVVNKFNPFDAKSDPAANQEENLKKQKEHEKIEDPREKVKPPHLLQQSPGHTQHSQHPQGPVKSTDTITPTQQQPSKSSQSGPKPIPLQQSTSKFPTQSSSTTKPSSHTPPPKEPLSHVKDPIKPVAQESKHTTSSSQFQGPKKETIKHDQSVTQGPMDMGKQNMQQSRPLTQSRYSSEVAKGPPHTTEPAKKLIKEPEKQPTQPQGPAKQIMQQAGPTGKNTQQATNMKQPIQQTLPLQQQTTTSMTSKQTAQKPEPSKPPETKQSSQSPRKPMPGLNQSAKMLPQQQDKFPEKIPGPKKQQQDSTQEMSKVAEKTMCPLCSTTELLLNTKEKANYNTCTQCHTTVCSLCGFNPNPDMTEIHEWLCLNCQMQRALGMDKNPPPSKPSPVKKKPASAVPSTKPTPESSQRKQSISAPEQNLAQVSKVATPVLTKQRSVTESPTSKSKKSFEPQTGNVPSKAELMEKPQQLSPENKQQQTKPEERVCDVPSSQVVPTKLDSLLPKVPSSPGKKDIDSKTRDTAKPEKSQLVEKLPVSQPVVQELQQSSASSTHPKLPPKPDTSKLEEDPKSSPSKINPNLNGKQVQKEAQVQPSPKPSPSHKPVVSQTMSHAQSEVQKDPLVQPSPKPSPSRKPVVPQTMSRTQPQVQKDSQALPSPKPSPSHKPVVPQSTSQVQPKVQKDPQVQPSPKPSPSHKPVIPQITSQVQPQVQKDPHVQPSPKPSPSHKPVIPQTTSQAQPQVQNDSNVQQSPKPSPSHKPVIPQTTSQAQPQVQNDLNVQQSPKPSPSHKPVVIQTMSQAQSQVQKDQKIQPGPKPSPSHKPVGPQATPQPQPDKSQGQPRRFSLNLGSTTETPKHQPTTPQGTVTGKLFGFGASIFSQASSFISTATQPSNQMQNTQGSTAKQPPSQQAAEPPTTAKDAMHDKQLHPPQKSSELPKTAKDAPLPKQPHPAQKTSELPKQPVHAPQSSKPQVVKKEAEPLPVEKTEDSKDSLIAKEAEHKMETKKETTTGLPKMEKIPNLKKLCPLCETELNIGSKDLPNFNTCTQCKNVVCNMCGFNPTPHLTEVVEWLCLNCQTHRAMTGQLVDLSKTSPPLGPPSKSSPKHTISLENQKEIHKVTTSSFTASHQSVTEVISKMSNEKVAMVPEEKSSVIPEEKISIGGSKKVDIAPEGIVVKASEEKADITPSLPVEKTGIVSEGKPSLIPVQLIEQEIDKDKLLLSLSEKVKKSVALPGEEVFPSKDINSLVPMEIKGIKPPEGKIMPKQDLMIDLSATLLKQIDEGTLENRIKPKPSQLIENEAGKEKTEKEDDKSDTSSSQQQKSPQGLSDTGYSSDGISGSLGEIPSLIPSDEKDLHKEPSKRETFSHENSPSSPSDLAKLESTVLSILEAQTSMLIDEKSRKSNDLYGIYGGQTRVKTKILPITPESFSSEEEELEDIQEEDEEILGENGKGIVSRKSHKDGLGSVRDITSRQRHDSLDDSSESENSPVPQRKRRISNGSSSSDDYKHEDSQGSGDDEDFIRKQIIEMSADEDASGSEDEEFIRTKLKEISGSESQKAEAKTKPVAAKCKRLTKKSSASYDDDGIRRHSWHHGDEEDEEVYDEIPEPKYRESKSQESEELSVSGGGGLRRFKTIELNSTISNTYSEEPCKQTTMLYYDEEPELEMESLTDSPEERSREERSSSLHASSFTPGTSPTSVSSLDEDSDSSPSHKKISGESKQQRKARHRSHGPVLPTIEDSSEEEELREEEELLKEQEKQRELEQQQRKGSSKKSKKDKDELRAQRRRERPKTPPSNLSPIEDASPTEELRQAAEMEELHRSSCSEYSPSIESEPEGFEISPEKIIEVQKVYKLPTSVSLYSPTDVTTGAVTEKKNGQRSLKNAEEAYEEILYKAKLYQTEKEKDEVFEKEPLYGGMLIEDYIYESLVEENYDESLDTNALSSQENVFDSQVSDLKNLTDDIRIDSVEKIIHFENECYTTGTFHTIVPQEDIVSSSYIVPESHEIIILDNADERQPEDTDTGFHDFISCQNMQLTPGSSPTQVRADFSIKTGYAQSVPADISPAENLLSVSQMETSSLANVISIPDVKITQHFTTEEPEEDTITDYTDQKMQDSAVAGSPAKSEEFVSTSVSPAIKDSESMELRNLDQQPVIKPEKYTGNALSTGPKERETDDNVMCAATSSSTCPGSNQVYSYTAHTTQPSLASDTTSVEHVIISVPEATTEITQTAGACSFDQEQGRKDVTKVMENTSINISEKKGETPRTVECSLLTKQSTSVTDTITSSPNLQSAASTVTSVTSKVKSLFRSSSSESTVPLTTPTPPPPPPLPPPTPSKPTVYSKKRPAPKVPSMEKNAIKGSTNETSQGEISLKNNATIVSKHHAPPPPVPPKPSSIPAGLVFSHRPTENRVTKARLSEQPTVMQKMQGIHDNTATLPATMSLNLIPSTECKLPSPTSPLSPHSNKSSPRWTKPSLETYVVITLPSEPGTPTDNVATDTTCWPLQAPPQEQVPQTAETVFSIMSLSQGETIQASFDSHPVPSPLSQVITTVSTKAAMSKASDLDSTATILQAESLSKQNAKASKSNNVIDLRTLSKIDNANNDLFMGICMDLSSAPLDAKRQSTSQGVSGRLVSAVQPAVVNLCSESTAMSSVLLPTEPYSIVTCSTTLGYTTSLESLVDLGNSMKAPLKLTSKQHEQASVGLPVEEEVPINLSMGMPAQSVISATGRHGSFSPNSITNGCTDISTSQESVDSGVVDLSTTKSHKTIVTVDETTSAIITEIIEDDKPVDLTAGRRAVCCDVVYKLPFGRSCISQQSSTNLPEDRFGYRDDHYQYDRSGMAGLRGVGGMKPSMSDTNLAEAGLFLYKSKNTFDYPIGVTEVAVDLTSGKMTTGEALDYKTKITSAYPETRQVISGIGMSAPQYSQARMTASILPPFGMGSVLRSSNGVVYSSVATPIPSTFAITTQPGSIFSTTVKDLSSFITSDTVTAISSLNQTQPPPRSYNILNTTSADVTDVMTAVESGFAVEVEATTAADLVSVITTEPESFSELTEDESAFLMPSEDGKQQQLHLQRELLELEKIKQQRLAEELEWERQEIQRFREQETFMVQKKLEELQSMKQQLLFQQEEERQAQYMMRQETLVQQQLHIEQIQQLQQQLHQQLEEQKLRQMYQYSYDTNETASPQTTSDQGVLEGQFSAPEDGQFWTSDHTSTAVSGVGGIEMPPSETWYTVQSDGITQYISRPGILNSISEMSLKDVNVTEERQLKKRSSMQRLGGMYDELDVSVQEEPKSYKLIVDSGVQTDDEDGGEKGYTGRRRRSKKGVDTSVQTDDEDQDEWDIPTRSRRRSRAGKYSEGNTDADKVRQFSKVSSIAVQTVAESSVQTEPLGTIRIPSVRAKVDAKVEIVKHISAPEKSYKGESLGCQTETEGDQSPQYLTNMPQKDKRRPTPLEIGYSNHLRAESSLQVAPSPPKSPKVLYSPISPVSPGTVLESAFVPYEKTIVDDIACQHTDINLVPPPSPKSTKVIQRSLSDPKPLSPTSEDNARTQFQYSDGYMTKTLSGTQKKVKRTLPNPPPEEASNGIQSPYNTVGSVSRRRICRNTTMARAKILQDIDRELDLVERESSKLRKKQAELDEEEKEIDAKLRYLEMGINRRKEALLKEREKRERAYLQGVAEERDYMSDSEVSSTRPTRIESHLGLDRPQTAAPTEYSPYLTPQTQSETHFVPPTSPYTQFQYQTPTLLTQAPTQYSQQSHYEQPLYHQQVSSYQTQPSFQAVPTMSFTPQQPAPTQQPSYKQHQSQMILMQQKRQGALDLDCKLTTHYDVIRNQPLIITPASTDNSYSVPHLGSKYSTLDLRLGLDEKSSMASSPMSSISADSFYADLDHHTSRNYVLIDDIGELTKGSGSLSSAFGLHEKELSKADRILRSVDARRTPEVTDFLAPMTSSARLHSYGKADEDSMEDPYELKLLKHQIKQEFRRGTENLDPLVGYSPYYHSDSLYRHFPKTEKYSISRLTLEKQAAKQLPPAILYQKQSKHKKAVIDPKIAKFSPIQESRDIEPDYSSYLSSSTSSIPSISSKVRLLQDDITYGLRKNITDQQKFLGPALAQNLGASLSPTLRTSMQDEVDKPYVSGSRSRPSSRPSSIYGLDLSIKRDLSSSSLRLKANEAETLDGSFSHVAPSGRTKPSSLPISQSRGRIPIVAQNSEEESPLSPVGQPMGMARASAGPLPPISADSRDQFGSSHSLPEVQQHMREESRTRGYDRDIAFIMDDFQHAMSDSEENSFNDAYHLRREETDWFDKPRESRIENGHGIDRKLPDKLSHARSSLHHEQVNGKPIHYAFPHLRFKLQKDPKDHTVSGNGFGIRVVGGKEVPGNYGETGAYIAKILPGGDAEHTGRLTEGMQVLEWNGYSLTGKTYEDVQSIIGQSSVEAEICVRLDLNMLSNSETPQNLELHEPAKPVDKTKSPGVDPKQLAAELQKVSQQQAPSAASAVEKGSYIHSGTTSAASSAVPSPGQPGSPSVSKKRHSSKSTEAIKSHSHPITGEIQLQVNYDKHLGNLIIHILQARNLVPRDNNGYSDPFVKVYLLPGRGQVMVVQNASAEYKRRTKHVQKSLNPEWNQTVIYKNISMEQLKKKTLEVTIWDYDRFSSNDFLGEVLIDLSNPSSLDNIPRWYQLKEQSESIDHAKPHSSQSNQQVPKPSVIKSRSHGIFPDPSKDMQIPTIEKSHSSPGSSKSSSEGHLRSHGPSRSQSKTSVTQTHLEDAGAAIAAAEAAVQQLRLQPTAHKSSQSNHARKQHRHSIAGVLPIQRTQSDNLPPPANDSKDQSQLALKKVNSDGSVKTEAKSTTQKPVESSVSTASSVSSFGSGYSMDSDGSNTTGDSNLFPAPRIGKINQNGQDLIGQSGIPLTDVEGKTQVMGEIKIALKKEMKTDGEQLIVEILQCRNITYKFKSPDHLPDLYVKLYVINIATQKRIIKKKTRVCRHDREPSFNETFRFSMSPAGHSLQILLVSNGGKFMKKTLIGEAYIWLDKVDLRKRIVNWHKLLVSSTQTH